MNVQPLRLRSVGKLYNFIFLDELINTDKNILVIIDFREKPSNLAALLQKPNHVTVQWQQLKAGDYYINNEILVERKTAADFVTSIISQRLFHQCARLVRTNARPLIIIEGDPYATGHNISHQAIQGALISISVAWQIPVLISDNKEDTVQMMIVTAEQSLPDRLKFTHGSKKPKRLKNKQIHFLRGIPSVGSSLAIRLLQSFNSIDAVINATINDLESVEGIGKQKAETIWKFLHAGYPG